MLTFNEVRKKHGSTEFWTDIQHLKKKLCVSVFLYHDMGSSYTERAIT